MEENFPDGKKYIMCRRTMKRITQWCESEGKLVTYRVRLQYKTRVWEVSVRHCVCVCMCCVLFVCVCVVYCLCVCVLCAFCVFVYLIFQPIRRYFLRRSLVK
jgi:hypothetical protein